MKAATKEKLIAAAKRTSRIRAGESKRKEKFHTAVVNELQNFMTAYEWFKFQEDLYIGEHVAAGHVVQIPMAQRAFAAECGLI